MGTIYKKDKNIFNIKILGILFMLPALLIIIITMIIPFIWNIILSFTSWDGNSSLILVGFGNFIKIFQDRVTLLGFNNSIFIAIVTTLIAVISGLILALMIYKTGKTEGAVFRFVFFTPSMTPLTVIGLLFVFILAPDIGLLNNFLNLIGLNTLIHAWLAEPDTVLWSISVIGGWRYAGIVMMLCYTSICTIPSSMFEAGRIDGAGYFKQIQMIILPIIKPIIELSTMFMLMWSFKTYDIIWAMTKGGPGDISRTVPVRMLDVGFQYNQFGYASAIGVMLTVIVIVSILAIKRIIRGTIYEY